MKAFSDAFPQAGLNPLPFFPAFDADLASLLLEADDADVVLGGQMADFVIAEATLGALEPDTCHPTLLHGLRSACARVGEVLDSAFSADTSDCRPLNTRKINWIIVDED